MMTALASELDEKLARLAPAKARALERLVQQAIALADAADSLSNSMGVEGGNPDWLDMQVQPLPLPTATRPSAVAGVVEAAQQARECLNSSPRLHDHCNPVILSRISIAATKS